MRSLARPKLQDDDFRALRELIGELSGIVVGDDARLVLERKLGERIRALRLPSFADYLRHLRRYDAGRDEALRIVEAVTMHETYFFRQWSQLVSFEREILPRLRDLAAARRSLTIWSAGCSTGEEAYTLAMIVARGLLFEGWKVEVLGTDISPRALEVARRGVYKQSSFRAFRDEFGPFFTAHGDERAVVPAIASLCRFAPLSLLDAKEVAKLGGCDVVFCRNVLMYLDAASRARVVQAFYERLHPGGYLLLGHSESLLHVQSPFELAQLEHDLAYRKPASEGTTRESGGLA